MINVKRRKGTYRTRWRKLYIICQGTTNCWGPSSLRVDIQRTHTTSCHVHQVPIGGETGENEKYDSIGRHFTTWFTNDKVGYSVVNILFKFSSVTSSDETKDETDETSVGKKRSEKWKWMANRYKEIFINKCKWTTIEDPMKRDSEVLEACTLPFSGLDWLKLRKVHRWKERYEIWRDQGKRIIIRDIL